MYIETSKNSYVYQFLAGDSNNATIGMNFIPPLNCFYQKSVNAIPDIDKIGDVSYVGDIIAITETGATLTVNGTVITQTPEPLIGNPNWVTYRIGGYTGDVSVESTNALSVGLFGFNGFAGFGGYYSGFGVIPQDTETKVCDNVLTELLELVEGNPEPGGVWTDPNGNTHSGTFDPAVDVIGVYNYYLLTTCDLIDIDLTITEIVEAKNAGEATTLAFCSYDNPVDLFTLINGTPDAGGLWLAPDGTDFSGNFDPANGQTGVYTYYFETDGPCEEITNEITVAVNEPPIINAITDFEVCDDDTDGSDTNGEARFNFTGKNAEILDFRPDLILSYHFSENDAVQNVGSSIFYEGTSTTIYVRLEDANSGCFSIEAV